MSNSLWTATEYDVLRALAVQVGTLSLDQIVRGWLAPGHNAEQHAESLITNLVRAKLICRRIVEAHPLICIKRPLFSWRPGKPAPNEELLSELSVKSCRRWTESEKPVEVFIASRIAVRLFGAFGSARDAKPCEATHDLHVSEVFIRYRRFATRLSRTWLGESAFPKLGLHIRGIKDPDAFLMGSKHRANRVVEFAGKYSVKHLQRFHLHCAGRAAEQLRVNGQKRGSKHLMRLYHPDGTGYEIW
jgi:hypothetical protein